MWIALLTELIGLNARKEDVRQNVGRTDQSAPSMTENLMNTEMVESKKKGVWSVTSVNSYYDNILMACFDKSDKIYRSFYFNLQI